MRCPFFHWMLPCLQEKIDQMQMAQETLEGGQEKEEDIIAAYEQSKAAKVDRRNNQSGGWAIL